MTRRQTTIAADWFDALYRREADPWGFRTSAYEGAKYQATLDALASPRYAEALEVGCAIGIFTRQLAERCDRLTALDGSATALDAARRECAGQLHVTFRETVVPAGFPDGGFDLIVLSEVLYYLDADDLAAMADRCCAALNPGGEMVLCHWLGETDYPLTGEAATDGFVAAAGVRRALERECFHDDVYRLERLRAA